MQNPTPNPSCSTEFTTFMRAYQDMVFSTVVRLTGDGRQAEDISQDVFLKAYESFEQLRTSSAAGGWLKTVATHLTLNHLSRYRRRWKFFSEMRRADADDNDDETPIDFPVPDGLLEGLDGNARRSRVEQAIKELPDHRRIPLVLYHFEDMSYQDIADRLRISLAKVKTDILRARAALAKQLIQS